MVNCSILIYPPMRPVHFHEPVFACHPAWLALLVLAASATGRAEPLDLVTIRWNAPPSCPSDSALRAQLLRDLHGSKTSRRLDADVHVMMLGSQRWQSRLLIRDDTGRTERVLSAQRCDALLSITSLVLATMIDPDLAPEHPDTSGADRLAPEATASDSNPSSGAEPVTADAPVAPAPNATAPNAEGASVPANSGSPPVTAPPPNQKRTNTERGSGRASSTPLAPLTADSKVAVGMSAAISGGVDAGSLPKTTGVLDARVALDLQRFRIETAFDWWLPQSATLKVSPDAAVTGRFSMIAVGARGCMRLLHAASLYLLPCAGLELERWRGRGDQGNIERSQTTALWGAGVTLGALGLLQFGKRLSLRGGAEAVTFIGAPTFGFLAGTTRMEVFQPDKLSFRGQMGLELDFW